MSKDVSIGGEPFTLSQQGDPGGWGEDQQDLIQALVDSVNAFFGEGDILPTTSLIGNNQPADTLISFFQFNSNVVRFAEVEYTVIRSTDAANSVVYEVGKIFCLNDPTASGNPWSINVQKMSDSEAGIDFGINSTGQMTYSSTDLEAEKGGNYKASESKISFKAKAIIK